MYLFIKQTKGETITIICMYVSTYKEYNYSYKQLSYSYTHIDKANVFVTEKSHGTLICFYLKLSILLI